MTNLNQFTTAGLKALTDSDPRLYQLLERETTRQNEVLTLVAAASITDPSVLACQGMATTNVTTEGYPGRRFHAGCEVVDEIENLAIERAKALFGAQYANVQPHSGTSANQVVIFSLLRPGDTLLGLDLNAGGHLTHGSAASAIGRLFNAVAYGLAPDGRIDYDQAAALARQHRPRLIICGASAYTRTIDFARFRAIADEVGAYLMADISHIAGLVAAGLHPSPIDQAHFTTTSTYKQLYGPRGGLVLLGRDHDRLAPDGRHTLAELMQQAVFPFFQGTPNLSGVAAKAHALARAARPEFRQLAERIVADAQALAAELLARGYDVLTGGTDNHTILIDLRRQEITGYVAEKALEACGIVVNKNRVPHDTRPALITSGMRLGTNVVAYRGLDPAEMARCADLVDRVLRGLTANGERDFTLPEALQADVWASVRALSRRFPIPGYPVDTAITAAVI